MDPEAYLQRIDYDGTRRADAATLRALHRAHTAAVPFENLDIARGVPIVLDEAAFHEKIVGRRRGGFCYELNGLFAALLAALGFRLDRLSARVIENGRVGPEFDHLVLCVHLEEDWLADVGFGDCLREPLRLVEGEEQLQDSLAYRLLRRDAGWVLAKRVSGEAWIEQYQFSLAPRELSEFAAMCRHHQSSPQSSFTRGRLITRPTPDGRITLSKDRLIITRGRLREERPIESEEQFTRSLSEHFDVDFDLEDPARHFIADAAARLRELKRLADAALDQVTDEAFFASLGAEENSLAAIVKHMAGNLRSRWTDFLTSDGEKPDRMRDREFEIGEADTRARLMEAWESGWRTLFASLATLTPADATRTVRIRHEPHTVIQAIDRQLAHYGYHVGQIVQLARHHAGKNWRPLSVPRGGSAAFNAAMDARRNG